MSLNVEFHLVQSFGHNSLNRNKDGAPKTGHLGGVRRIEVSSQCWKRVMREAFDDLHLLEEGESALRTINLVERVAEKVSAPAKMEPERVRQAVARALAGGGLKADADTAKMQYLLFVPRRIVDAIAALVTEHLAVLLLPAPAPAQDAAPDGDAPKKTGKAGKRQEKAAAKGEVPADFQAKIAGLLSDSRRTPAIALFGSTVADAAQWNVEAAAQVAFAVSVHQAEVGYDFWTGLSDDRTPDQAGADMMGTAPFASGACFYRHLIVDVGQLVQNLGGDAAANEQGKRTVAAFLRSAMLAIPSGKQNSTAANNLPSFALVDVRQGRPRSLNDAFVVPVHPSAVEHGGMVDKAVLKLAEQLSALDSMYGTKGRKELAFSMVDPGGTLAPAFLARVPSAKHRTAEGERSAIDMLIAGAVGAAFGAA